MGSPEIKLIPTEFDVGVDATVTTVSSAVLTGDRDAPITMRLDPLDVSATLKGDAQAPITANAGIDLHNLPHLTFDQITELVRTVTLARSRIRFPLDLNVGLSVFPLTLLGIDALSLTVCGEPAVIRDDCVPPCEEPCEEGEKRPPKGVETPRAVVVDRPAKA